MRIASATFWSLLERFGAKAARFILGIILARLLAPADFGVFALALVFVELASTLANSGMSSVVVQRQNLSEPDMDTAFWFNVALGLLLGFLLFTTAAEISRQLGQAELEPVLQVLAVVPVISALRVVQGALLVKYLRIKTAAIASLSANLFSGVAGVICAFQGFGVWALVVQQVLLALSYSLVVWSYSDWTPRLRFSGSSLRTFLAFSFQLVLIDLVDRFSNAIYFGLLGKSFSAGDVGLFSRSKTLQELPAAAASAAVGSVTFPLLCEAQSSKAEQASLLRNSLAICGMLMIPSMALLWLIADPLIPLLLTEKWSGAIPLFQWLCILGVMFPMERVFVSQLLSLGMSKTTLYTKLAARVVVIGSLLLLLGQDIEVIAAAYTLSHFPNFFILAVISSRLSGYRVIDQMRDQVPFLAGTAVAAMGAVFVSRATGLGDAADLLLQAAVFGLVYPAFLAVLNDRAYKLVLSSILAYLDARRQ